MPYSLQARLGAILNVSEIVAAATSPASGDEGNRRTYDQYSIEAFLHSASFPPIAGQVADLSWTLAGASKDFDLVAAPWAGNPALTFDATGKKIVALLLNFANGNNAAGVAVSGIGANAYGLFGTTTAPKFYPGFKAVLFLGDPANTVAPTNNLPTVAAAAKDIRFAGTAADVWKALAIFSA